MKTKSTKLKVMCDNCKDWITQYEYNKNQGLCKIWLINKEVYENETKRN